MDFGDGSQQSLGAISGSTTVQHTYATSGTFSVSATALDASGFTEQVGTSLTILPAQPPAVTIAVSNNNPSVGETVILTATASGATSTILSYQWNLGANAVPPTAETTATSSPSPTRRPAPRSSLSASSRPPAPAATARRRWS